MEIQLNSLEGLLYILNTLRLWWPFMGMLRGILMRPGRLSLKVIIRGILCCCPRPGCSCRLTNSFETFYCINLCQ